MASQLSGPILIVEDDADIRESLEGFLELQGYTVVAVGHGREAIAYLQGSQRPAILLLDMAMPVMDGHRLLTFRKENPALQEVPVVIISAGMAAMNPRDRALYAANYNVAFFIKKPADPQLLLEVIGRHALRSAESSAGAPA
ncbi:MAG TPA: response regulator [Myxococcaceae bacterium]|nr:response regulator [Myxococcaceae bacterium]